ncbi:hypothetical protein FSP39_024033 [Pinctada imbricata]|uniref:Uncharacterized protein n=1 Tax=Pinctada imbricata TaxID=66713 RepID=A0AA89CB83_PINIB|nr:hypothetical protein FSP39_024033 [Pinctada imbricata]
MATEADSQYEASDESSENELLDCSLSVWKGLGWNVKERFDPVPLDLHTASSIGQYDCVRDFISKQVDLNKKNRGGWTPLMYACYIGHDNIVNLLLDASVNQGAELEARDAKGWTALFHATYAGHQNMVKFLLEQGANINAVEPSLGLTPFMEAAAEGHEIIVQLFLQHGVNVNRKAYNGDTARSLALIHSNMKIVSLIDNHIMPNTCLRSEAGLEADLSSSDEGYPKKRGHKGQKGKGRVPSIRDGPDAIARLIDRSRNPDSAGHPKVPKGYVTFPQGEEEEDEATKLSYRDVTSPINMQDYKALDSSGGKDSVDNDVDEDGNAFSKTCALTIKSSSGSSVGLMAALGLSHSSADSESSHPQDSPSSLDDSAGAGDLGGSTGFHDDDLSPASSYHKAMEKISIKEGTEVKITGDDKTQSAENCQNDKQVKRET